MCLEPWSRLTLRAVDSRIGELIQIAGKAGIQRWRPDGPRGRAERFPAAAVPRAAKPISDHQRIHRAGNVKEAVRRQLDALGRKRGDRSNWQTPDAAIRDKEIVGFEVLLEGLTAEESLTVQKMGLGGRRHMGCGIFAPPGDTGPS